MRCINQWTLAEVFLALLAENSRRALGVEEQSGGLHNILARDLVASIGLRQDVGGRQELHGVPKTRLLTELRNGVQRLLSNT